PTTLSIPYIMSVALVVRFSVSIHVLSKVYNDSYRSIEQKWTLPQLHLLHSIFFPKERSSIFYKNKNKFIGH
ncbi:MAG: hypothetical protein WCA39_04225, partial [Nitrososphaeraceae archaeon]